jgi:amino acid transporter
MIMVNIYGAKQGAGVVKVIAIIKLLPILGIIVFGFSKANSQLNLQMGTFAFSLKALPIPLLFCFLLLQGLKQRLVLVEKLKTRNGLSR